MTAYFLPYQRVWLADTSRLKIWEKSRRIGATYVQAYEDVVDASKADGSMDVWFTSANSDASKEYIRYAAMWARLLKIAADDLGEVVIDKESDIRALAIEFATGKRVYGLSSNPKSMRGKGGKLVIDEYAYHDNPDDLWAAAGPVILWGHPVRVLSTYNGSTNRFARLVTEARQGNKWSLHTTTIEDAVAQGIVEKITGKTKTTQAEREAFMAECREIAGDEATFAQEFMCVPMDANASWLDWESIIACEHEDAGKSDRYTGGDVYVGVDIGRKRDLTVIWVVEKVGDIAWTREVVSLKAATFAEQDHELDRIMAAYRVRRVCMDATGLGMKPVEDAQGRHGKYRIEGVTFTAAVKQELATITRQAFERATVRIPIDKAVRTAHRAVRRIQTAAGNIRFDADRTEAGHADEFWAHALALHAAEGSTYQPYYYESVKPGRDPIERDIKITSGIKAREGLIL
ncbi:MAG: terminase family protein [Pseudomonadota bacterium]